MEKAIPFDVLNTSIPITILEGLLILITSSIAGLLIRYLFINYGDSMSMKTGFGNSILISTISVASLIAVVKTSLALSLGLVGALSVIRFRTAVKEPYNLAFILFSFCVAIALGASHFRFALMLLITGAVIIISIRKYSRKFEFRRNLDGIDNINIELPSGSDLEDIYTVFEQNLATFSIKAISERKDGSISLTIKASIPKREILEKIRREIRLKYKENSFAFYGSTSE